MRMGACEKRTNMKKIGLVPLLYKEYNYGGILQLYALQRVIKQLGYDVEIVKFDNDEKIREFRTSLIKKKVLSLKKRVYRFIHKNKHVELSNAILDRKKVIDAFKEERYCKTVNEKDVDLRSYSSFVCGSDQIWNPNWARRRCFLEFVPDDINKVIYAASLGVEKLDHSDVIDYKKRIGRINHVSVREYSAKNILDEVVDRNDIVVVADPTLLLFPEEWYEICEENIFIGRPYVFCYFLGDYSQTKKIISDFAKKKQLIVVNIPFASTEKMDIENYGDEKVVDASPGRFLSLIRNAEYIFTDSFHACVFSTLFEKEYYAFERDGNRNMMDRIVTLQRNFGTHDRIIPIQNFTELEHLDYSNNRNCQTKLRAKSIEFLLESLRDGR